jgi:hypothetical protein
MSILRYPLFFLPIHHYTRKKYYQRHDEHVKKEKRKEEKDWGEPFEKLSEENRSWLERSWWWPPWKFNDIVGYLDIGTDIGNCLTADIYLKRKYLPKEHHYKRIRKPNDFLPFRGISRFPVRERKNDVYLSALDDLIAKAKKVIKKRNRTFELWLPPFDFSCIDFVEAVRQAEIKRVS